MSQPSSQGPPAPGAAPPNAVPNNGARQYPELPPGLGEPPHVDVDRVRSHLEYWADRYAAAGVPDKHTQQDVPLHPERAVEAWHTADQERALQWCKRAGSNLEGMRTQVSSRVDQARERAEALESELSAAEGELNEHQHAVTASAPADRYRKQLSPLRRWSLALPFIFMVPEYLIIASSVGRALSVFGGVRAPIVVALSLSQILLAELTGGLARRWLVSLETAPVRRAEAAALGFCSLVLLSAQVAIVLARWQDTGGGLVHLLLAGGTQFAVIALSVALGWMQVDPPEVASRRSLATQVDELRSERDAVLARQAAAQRELGGLEGLVAGWQAWARRHQVGIQKLYDGELKTFRARLTDGLRARGLDEPVFVLAHLAEPPLEIPVEQAGLDEDDDLLDQPPSLNLGP